jgi:hypothetical protein
LFPKIHQNLSDESAPLLRLVVLILQQLPRFGHGA